MQSRRITHVALPGALSMAFLAAPVSALDFDFYSSLRVAGEAVDQDGAGSDDYTAFRDAYSRIGFKADHQFNDAVTGYAQFELPIDVPNKAIQDPFNQGEDIRIAKIGVKGGLGDLAVGQMWMPYYNAIAYPVDMFSSYYSGFATFTSFRLGDTVTYYTPSWNGFSAAAAYSDENGSADSSGNPDDRLQGTLSYSTGGLTVSGGIDDFGGVNDTQLLGASVMWQATDALFLGAKYEEFNSDKNTGTYGDDGDSAANLYAGYTIGKNTLKAMIASVDNYGDDILHLGVDHQYSKDLKFFVEYYSEDEAAAITDKRAGGTCTSCTGGSVITAGLRWDFGAP